MRKYAGLIKNDIANGEGVCVSYWVQGCPHHCPGCHNPETWDFDGGLEQPWDLLKQIKEAIRANGIQRNFSILGGEPLCPENIYQTETIVCYIRDMFPDIKIFLWTGYTLEELKEYSFAREARAILDKIDVLIDGPYIEEQRDITLKLRGSRNQKIRKKGIDF